MLTQSTENFLKTLYELQGGTEWVSTNALAERLGHKPASVTNMVQKLAGPKLRLIEYHPYQGARLTRAGERVALEVIRHHRLIELYLSETLGVPWDRVHEEAEKLEHVISEDLEDRMSKALGNPTTDPHGAPIPPKKGAMPRRGGRPLLDIPAGVSVEVVEVADGNPDLLRLLGKLGLYPKTRFKVVSREPLGGTLKVRVGRRDHHLGENVARHISVSSVD